MQAKEFLAMVLPAEGQGRYCVFELPSRRTTFLDSIEALGNTAELLSHGNINVFYGLSIFKEESRTASNALAVRALWIDIDCGANKDSKKTYPTKRDAVAALQDFLEATGLKYLGDPWLVDSGGGVHVYWPLYEDVCIDDWKPIAEAMKYTAQRLGFKIDMTVTADAARVLRVPGTFNQKFNPPREVKIKQQGDVFDINDIYGCLDKVTALHKGGATAIALPSIRPAGLPAMSPTMKALTQNSVTYFKNIMVRTLNGTGCGQLEHYVENAADDGMEPLWRGMLSLAKVCDDGDKAAVKLTAMHPYTTARMNQKLAEIKGPYSCVKLDSENPGICGNCPHWGAITNPLALGRSVATTTTALETIPEAIQEFHPGAHLQAPPPPRGYSYGTMGGVYRTVSEADSKGNITTSEVMLTPYTFYMIDLLNEVASHTARFVAIRSKSVTYVEMPLSAVPEKTSCIKQLSSQNIMAAFGTGNDKHLHEYVRACIEEASSADKVLRIPPHYGWQPDNSFALCERVIQPAQQGYDFPSVALKNLITATRPKGTLGEWQRFVQLVQDKGLWDILALAGVSFGAPLMEFASAGTPFCMFHACSDKSGNGKSLSLQLAASVWGHPLKFPVPPETSKATMMQRTGMLNSLPFFSDEITAIQRRTKGEFIPDLVFGMSQGMHKIKGSNAANAEILNELTWRTMGLVTSNEPAMEKMLNTRDTSSNGEFYRMLEWSATKPVTWTDAERLLEHTLENNYGQAGRVYAEWLVNNRPIAQDVTQRCIAKVRQKLGAADVERFWVNGLGALLAGLTLAGSKYANVFNFDTASIFKYACTPWVLAARQLIAVNTRSAEDLLHAYTREFHGHFVRLDHKKGPTALFDDGRGVSQASTRGKVAGRIEYDIRPGWIDYYIELATFKRYCAERNHSYMSIKHELAQTMAIEEVRKDLLSNTGGPTMRVLTMHISQQIEDAP